MVSPGTHRRFNIAAARIHVPGVHCILVASVHVASPVSYQRDYIGGWQTSINDAKEVLEELASTAGHAAAVIIAGDFNSTPNMQQYRDLLTNGYRDPADQTGAGFVPTFPADSWLPPALAIDHVLTRAATATSLSAVTVAGSDHRALLTTVQIPKVPQSTDDD
ncbi:endonuclease/exonuclease/phosphatase family protein [Mycolicibacterium aichiense]|uniref:endonuclease/exonuclease/phosphatase family protein n=1 Tax=Mycolicibacterium aichiense TaxID=1799 RepID=UPI003D66C068